MKPGDHPEFFRLPAPAGHTRESTIVLDRAGRFWHDNARIEKPSLVRALTSWIRRHPDDGRFILENGYDWTYFTVEDVPFFVEAARGENGPDGFQLLLKLSDDSVEILNPEGMWIGPQDALYVQVKGGRFEARFTQRAQLALAPLLVAGDTTDKVGLQVGKTVHWIPLRSLPESAKRGS
jgi:hypothetical protein